MKTILVLLCLLVLSLTGCTTKSKARAQAQQAFEAGRKQAMQNAPPQQPSVMVVGQVRNRVVPWREGLTLGEAIDAAVYTGFTNPRMIRLTRGTEFRDISPNDLLRSAVNPTVEAGDVIEIRQ